MTPFMRGLTRQPPMVKAWVGLLVLVNVVASLFFLPPLEANVVLVTLGLSGVMMELLTWKQGFTRLQQQLIEAWLDIADAIAVDPLYLERGGEDAEQLMVRAESLAMVRSKLFTSMAGPQPGPQMPPTAGRFQFVEWDQEPTFYWVLDTTTGQLDRRQAPH